MTTSSPIPQSVDGRHGAGETPMLTASVSGPAAVAERPSSPASLSALDCPAIDRDALFAEFAPLVRRLIRQYGADDPELREDMRGEIYFRFCQLCSEFDPERGIPLRPYLVRKLTASAYTFARQHWRHDRRELSIEFGEEFGDPGPATDPTERWDHALALESVLNILPEGITELPRRQRQLVVWRYYEQRSFEEIAERLDIRVATARSILRHGLNNLRKWIQREKLDWDA